MKILVCVTEYPPGRSSGIGNMTSGMVKEFRRRGHTCTICSPVGPDIKLGSEKLILKTGGIGLLYFWSRVSSYFKSRPTEYDAVWLHWPLFITRNPFPNSVATFHGTYKGFRDMASTHFLKTFYSFMGRSERYCLRNLKEGKVIAISTRIVRELELQGLSSQYIPVGIDIDRFHYRRRAPGSPWFIYVGRLEQPKNLFQLVDTFAEIKKTVKNSVLAIVGKGSDEESLKEYIAEKKTRDIRFMGYIPNESLSTTLTNYSYIVMPSIYEGQPIALLEGMSTGLIPIVNDIPALSSIVEESSSGLTVDFGDPIKSSSKIVEYISNPSSQLSSVRASRYVERNISLGMCVDKYLEVLRG